MADDDPLVDDVLMAGGGDAASDESFEDELQKMFADPVPGEHTVPEPAPPVDVPTPQEDRPREEVEARPAAVATVVDPVAVPDELPWTLDVPPPRVDMIQASFNFGIELAIERLNGWLWNAVYNGMTRSLEVTDRHGNVYKIEASGKVVVHTSGTLKTGERELRKASRCLARCVQRALEKDAEMACEEGLGLPDAARLRFRAFRVTNMFVAWRLPMRIDMNATMRNLQSPEHGQYMQTMYAEDGVTLRVAIPKPKMTVDVKPDGLLKFYARDEEAVRLVAPLLYEKILVRLAEDD